MVNTQMLDNAISAHANWKTRLRTAVSNGTFDMPASAVRVDNKCDFGKWLYGSELSLAEKQSGHCQIVKQLHAQFHQEAAKVVDCINSGQKEAAEKALGLGGSYAKLSSALTEAMIKWRQSLHQ